ncbi:MAG: phasin family protein [Rhodospirillales bacterium]|nr:phasin family protein [Rhodospirillales bacterium]
MANKRDESANEQGKPAAQGGGGQASISDSDVQKSTEAQEQEGRQAQSPSPDQLIGQPEKSPGNDARRSAETFREAIDKGQLDPQTPGSKSLIGQYEQPGNEARTTAQGSQTTGRGRQEPQVEQMREATQGMADQQARMARNVEQQGRHAATRNAEMAKGGAEMAKGGVEMAKRGMQQAADVSRRQTDATLQMMGMSPAALTELSQASRDDMEAMVESSTRIARDFQEMGMEWMHITQESLRMSMKAANELMECRSMEDLVQTQRHLMKESMDVFLNESSRLLQLSSRLTTDAVNPFRRS